jgi:hypothetical protein
VPTWRLGFATKFLVLKDIEKIFIATISNEKPNKKRQKDMCPHKVG